jgi:hypothetical protein
MMRSARSSRCQERVGRTSGASRRQPRRSRAPGTLPRNILVPAVVRYISARLQKMAA